MTTKNNNMTKIFLASVYTQLPGPAQSLGELGTRLGPPFDKAQKKI